MIKLVHITTMPQSLFFFLGQIRYLKSRGFEVHVVSSPGVFGEQVAQSESVDFHKIPMSRTIAPIADIVSLFRLRKVIKDLKPSIVHSHTPKAALLGTLAARSAFVPIVILSVFGLPQMALSGWEKALLDLMTRLGCALADRVWCDSYSMKEYIVGRHICPAEKAVVIANGTSKGVDAENTFSPSRYGNRSEIRANLAIPADSRVIGFVGRIVKDKGIREIADAWRILSSRREDIHLIFVGPYEERDPIPKADAELFRTDPRIHFLGQRSNVADYLAAMDVFVMPSYREGFPLTNLEASAMELPVVSTKIPGCIDSVKDGETGLLVPPRDVGLLVKAIETYLDDSDLRKKHGQQGRIRVLAEFRPEMIWEGLFNTYTDLLREKHVTN
jgi:glycosyltransferase involved in cell wall biosynthesis